MSVTDVILVLIVIVTSVVLIRLLMVSVVGSLTMIIDMNTSIEMLRLSPPQSRADLSLDGKIPALIQPPLEHGPE
jgi:Na+/pantothenate symporter